jgi:hypothetical protein
MQGYPKNRALVHPYHLGKFACALFDRSSSLADFPIDHVAFEARTRAGAVPYVSQTHFEGGYGRWACSVSWILTPHRRGTSVTRRDHLEVRRSLSIRTLCFPRSCPFSFDKHPRTAEQTPECIEDVFRFDVAQRVDTVLDVS